MAIIWADFPSGQHGLYGTDVAKMLDGVWAQMAPTVGTTDFVLTDDPDPAVGSAGRVLRFPKPSGGASSSTWDIARFIYPSAAATTGVAFRLYIDGLPGQDKKGFRWEFRDSANTTHVSLYVKTTGAIAAYRGTPDSGTLLGETTGPVLTSGAYNHIETKVLISDTVGTVEVRVNGTVKLSLTGQDTKNTTETTTAQIAFLVSQTDFAAGGYSYMKDLIFWDTSGSFGNNFLGAVSVRDLYTNSDVSLNWAPSTGSTGYDLIDETSPNDADYIEADNTPPAAAVMGLTDLPVEATSVKALLPIIRAQKSDGGDCNLQVGLTPDNTNWDDGADRPLTTAFTYWWDVSHASPATAVAWTPAEVNAAYVRFDRTL